MKIALSILGLALVSLFSAPAQVVTVQLTLEQEQFLPGETLPVTVHIVNNSGQSLHLGADAKWLTFTVESADDNFVVMKNADPPVTGEFNLGSSEVATKRVDLTPYFAMTHAGRYRVVATVHIPEWGADVTSPAKEFDIIDGARLWSQDFGMPVPAGVTNQPPVVRKYILEEANYLRQQLRMYVLVSDQSGSRILKVSAIGPMVSFSRPEAQLDRCEQPARALSKRRAVVHLLGGESRRQHHATGDLRLSRHAPAPRRERRRRHRGERRRAARQIRRIAGGQDAG